MTYMKNSTALSSVLHMFPWTRQMDSPAIILIASCESCRHRNVRNIDASMSLDTLYKYRV